MSTNTVAGSSPRPRIGELRWRGPGYLAILLLAYVPPLLTDAGKVAADTKTYLYLDPGRVLGRAASMWDPNIGFGTVTHQNIGYLFPMGPFYWLMQRIGSPDWVAQRIWLGSLVAGAGFGVVYLCRALNIRGPGVAVTVVGFMFSPYSLDYAARISVLLGPWAALPWMIGLVVKALREPKRWRYPALFALVVQLVGGVNATALIFAGVGPVLWLLWQWLGTREATWRDIANVATRVGVLSGLASAWWIAGLSLQGSYGLDILKYTETVKAVARTSSPNEVMRGLGYWFFYGRDRLGPWIEAAYNYTQRPRVLFTGYAISAMSLLAMTTVRWKHRGYFVIMTAIGVVIAVGAHPYDAPTPLGGLFKSFANSNSAGLALRSTGRATPLVILGFSMLLGIAVTMTTHWLQDRVRGNRLAFVVAPLVVLIILSNFPALYDGTYYGKNLERSETIPKHWRDLADYLNRGNFGSRTLELPGADFASYTFGNTVDPITPGLTDKPYVARELIPYGSPPSADFLNAFDRRLQEGTFSPNGFIDVLHRAGIDTVVVRNDIQWERYNLVRPRELALMLSKVKGLKLDRSFGKLVLDSDALGIVDERTLNSEVQKTPRQHSIVVLKVPGDAPIIRAQSADAPIVIAGDGEGFVDAADAGALHGGGTVLYSAAFEKQGSTLRKLAGNNAVLVLTDQNRKRGRRWSTVLDNTGYTERTGEKPLAQDVSDNRLAVFPDTTDASSTVTEQIGGTTQATAYGNPVSFTPEDRPAFAFDGNVNTAWSVGAFDRVNGHRIEFSPSKPMTSDHITLVQILSGPRDRYITKVRVRFDDQAATDFDLSASSRRKAGATLKFAPRSFKKVSIEIVDTNKPNGPLFGGMSAVGFVEIRVADIKTPSSPVHIREVTRLPTDLMTNFGAAALQHPMILTLTRLRVREVPPRSDEESSMVRSIEMPTDRTFALNGDARVFSYATDPREIDRVLGAAGPVSAWANQFLAGCLSCRGASAFDGDPATAWTTPVNAVLDQWLAVQSDAPVRLNHIDLSFIADPQHSVPTKLKLQIGSYSENIVVPKVTMGTTLGTRKTVRIRFPMVMANKIKMTITKLAARPTKSFFAGDDNLTLPVAIAEVNAGGLRVGALPQQMPARCRTDLLRVNSHPVGIKIIGATSAALAGDPLQISLCGASVVQLRKGPNEVTVVPGRDVALQLDRLVLSSAPGGAAAPVTAILPIRTPPPTVTVGKGRTQFTVSVHNATEPFWFVLGQSNNAGWTAKINGGPDLGGSTLVEGYANGWRIDPHGRKNFTIAVEWAPQRRVWISLAVTGFVVLLCFAIVIGSSPQLRRRRLVAQGIAAPPCLDVETESVAWAFSPSTGYGTIGHRRLFATAMICGGIAAVIAAPWIGALTALAVVSADRVPRLRVALLAFSAATMLGVGIYIVQAQWRYHNPPVFEWPTLYDAAVNPAWIALMVACSMWVLDEVSERSPAAVHTPKRTQTETRNETR